jgi:protein-glutamine gamma-glutamyltransferase
VNNSWNQWVLNYTQGRQLDLLRNLGFDSPSWADLAYVLIGVIVMVSLVGAAWALWERQQHDPWLRTLARVRRRLARLGVQSAEHATPRELARVASAQLEDKHFTQALTAGLLRLEALRYAPRSDDTLSALHTLFRQLPWPDRRTPS